MPNDIDHLTEAAFDRWIEELTRAAEAAAEHEMGPDIERLQPDDISWLKDMIRFPD